MKYPARAAFLSGALSIPFTLAAQAGITIAPQPLDPRGESKVTFANPVTNPGVHIDPDQWPTMRPYQTDDSLYRVYVAFNKTSPTVPPSDINYYLYSQPVSATDRNTFTEYVVVGTPYGDFSDQWSSVRFTLSENGNHPGSLELPIHSFSNAAEISVVPELPNSNAGIELVPLSQGQHKIPFSITNSLKNFEIRVDGADLTPSNDRYWRWQGTDHRYVATFSASSSRPPYVLSTAPLSGMIELQPDLWKSLLASAGSFRSDQFHDEEKLIVRYSASLGGNPRALPVSIKVRFRPPWWSLLGCAILGALFGSIFTSFFPDTWKGRTRGRTMRSAVLLAVVAEILGGFMFLSDDSKLVIASFNLNPTEVFPAFVLGLLAALFGLKILDAFKIPLPTR